MRVLAGEQAQDARKTVQMGAAVGVSLTVNWSAAVLPGLCAGDGAVAVDCRGSVGGCGGDRGGERVAVGVGGVQADGVAVGGGLQSRCGGGVWLLRSDCAESTTAASRSRADRDGVGGRAADGWDTQECPGDLRAVRSWWSAGLWLSGCHAEKAVGAIDGSAVVSVRRLLGRWW